MTEASPITKSKRKARPKKWEVWYVRWLITVFLEETGPRTIWAVIQYFTEIGYRIPEATVIRAIWCMDMNGELEVGQGGLLAAHNEWSVEIE